MRQFLLLAIAPLALAAAPAFAQHDAASPYDRDVISVVTLGRHSTFPTASCLVWANAEGLGVGPAQLHGYHGVSMQINIHPMSAETNQHPTTFANGLSALKSEFPDAPAWIVAALEKNRDKIEAGCAEDHTEPYIIHKITRADQR
jgi:hypothetical protein